MSDESSAEASRQAAVDQYEIVDTFAEQAFDDLTRLAAQTFDTPIALIAFLDHDRNWYKSSVGMAASETPREFALCEHMLQHRDEALVVSDTATDERFSRNPLVIGEPYIRFYAGAPLIAPSGHVLGAICAIDTKPREVRPEAVETLLFLAKQVIEILEQRRLDPNR